MEDKVTLAIGKIYRARPSQEDKDLSFIVLKLGSPTLLSILCKANKLSSTSIAYRIGHELKPLHSPVTNSATKCMQSNLDVDFFVKNNTVQGACYQHPPSDLKFKTF